MEFKLKTFLSFICLLNLFNQVYLEESKDLNPNGDVTFSGKTDSNFLVKLGGNHDSFADYIDITFTAKANLNPMISISTDKDCLKNRLFTATQLIEPIYIFLKKGQIKDQLYICVKGRANSNLTDYTVYIKNEQAASIPYNQQASYYIAEESGKEMKFNFDVKDDSTTKNSKVTFWIKGKSIKKTEMTGYDSQPFDYGFVYYGAYSGQKAELVVQSDIGDYVTIGSTIITDGITKEMKENANEIMVTSNELVCFPIKFKQDIIPISGKVYTKKAKTYYATNDKKEIMIDETSYAIDITNGIIGELNLIGYLKTDIEEGLYCLKNIDNKLMIASIQTTNSKDVQIIYPPLLPGEITRHYLKQNQFSIFHSMMPSVNANEYNMNLKSLKGFPEMYMTTCDTFPDCKYSQDSPNLIRFYPANRMNTFSYDLVDFENYELNPIENNQVLMVVYCGKGGKEEILGESTFCEFETTYFTNIDSINLYQESSFSQYLLNLEEDNYEINLINEDTDLIYLDLLIFSGDADIILNDFTGKANKYYLSNKVFYSIRLDSTNKIDRLKFKVLSHTFTFYMVQYKLLKQSQTEEINTLESGINYITSKVYVPQTQKHIEFLNFKDEYKQPYLATFYSPNCKFTLELGNDYKEGKKEIIEENTYVTQTIITPENSNNYGEKFDFFYTIKESDDSQYPNKLCMVYASGLELSNSSAEWNERAISLSEGVPHRYKFSNQYPFIVYAYHVGDFSRTLVIDFNLIDKENFDITIDVNRTNFKKTSIYRNSQFYINENEFKRKCNEYEVCTVEVKVQMSHSSRDRNVELTMYQINGAPFYLAKNVLKDDIINGNYPKHYYFDISNGEHGDITLDFKRGSGNIYASIVKKNLIRPMIDPNWRGIYHFPTDKDESLQYQTYTKKIIISEDKTSSCSEGCYVLITISSNLMYYNIFLDEETPFRISINPRIMNQKSNPIVKINVNEFIIGDINTIEKFDYDYYSVILPYDSDYVIFDWQADSPNLLINVGQERPNKDKAHFKLEPFSDCILELKKENIITEGNIKSGSLLGVELTIGIYSSYTDSIKSSPYAFKIFLPPNYTEEDNKNASQIIHIRSDQKVQCRPFKRGDDNICLFAVIFDDGDIYSNLIVYPRNQDGSPLTVYGNLLNAEGIERNNISINYIIDEIQKEGCKVHKKYVYITDIDKSKSYFFMTISNKDYTIVEVLSSIFFNITNNMNFFPNPSTAQIFFIDSKKKINLKFLTTQDLLLNIVCVSGKGIFYWEDEDESYKKYGLNDFGDRISLTSYTQEVYNKLAPLSVESLTKDENSEGLFIFYITYYPRNYLDQLKTEVNIKFNYRTARMPLNYYAPIILGKTWIINFIFKDLNLKNKKNLEYDNNFFNIWAKGMTNVDASEIRYNPELRPVYDERTCIKGVFDSVFGNIFISSKYINEIFNNFKDGETPELFFTFENTTVVNTDFASVGLEINIYTDDITSGLKDAPQNVFLQGKFSNQNKNKFIYLLKLDVSKLCLNIMYSTNSHSTRFILSKNIDSEKNDEGLDDLELKNITLGGMNILSIKFDNNNFGQSIYFIVFNENQNLNNKLDNFIFLYSLSTSSPDLSFLPNRDKNKLEVKIVKNIFGTYYVIKFNPINKDYISYYIKAFYTEGFIEGEKIDTIAFCESPGKILQINNPETNENADLLYTLKPEKDVKFIKILAFLKTDGDEMNKILYSYSPFDIDNAGNPRNIVVIYLTEGKPTSYTFSYEKPNVVYGYNISNIKETLVMDFNLTDNKYIDVNIYINREFILNQKMYKSNQIYIEERNFTDKCPSSGICEVNVEILIYHSETERTLVLTMYQINDHAFYLNGNIFKDDIVFGNKFKYYYLDIKKVQYGDITVDFKRGGGNIYASVVKKIVDKPLDNPKNRYDYNFPTTSDKSLQYLTYGKKIVIGYEDTDDCGSDGCYVLVSIVSNIKNYGIKNDEKTPFRISINPRIMLKDQEKNGPPVYINLDEFVIGDINLIENVKYDYYYIKLPYDSEYVVFDWQADSPNLLINVGGDTPTAGTNHIPFPPIGHDNVYKLNKNVILKKVEGDKSNGLNGVVLTLGIYSNYTDSIQLSPYAFKISMPPHKEEKYKLIAQIIKIRGDQKVQCLPFSYDDEYICIFAVIFDDGDINSNLLVYPRNQDDSDLTIYGNFINAEDLENNDKRTLEVINDIWNNNDYKSGKKYIYHTEIDKTNSYLFITSSNNNKTIVEVLSSTFRISQNNIQFSPNPSTPQIFAIGNNNIILNFLTSHDLLLNIVCISGRGKIYFENKEGLNKTYFLNRYDDRIKLTTSTNETENQLVPLRVESLTNREIDEDGFIFYITYYPRSYIDQLKPDVKIRFNYRTAKMPLNYYVPITLDNSWIINLNFYDLSTVDNTTLVYDSNSYSVWAKEVTNQEAVKIRYNPKYRPKYDANNCIKGAFDAVFGNIIVDSDYIFNTFNNINTSEYDTPDLFFTFENEEGFNPDFTSLGVGINIYPESDSEITYPIPEGSYIHGKLDSDKPKLIYHLRIRTDRNYYQLEFSAVSDSIKYALSPNNNSFENVGLEKQENTTKYGKNIINFELKQEIYKNNKYLYLIVFNTSEIKPHLGNFLFRYRLFRDDNERQSQSNVTLENIDISASGKDYNYTISFNPLPYNGISYFIKAYYEDGFIQGENVNSIAISESPGTYIQMNSPEFVPGEKITHYIKIDKNVNYIKILVGINDNLDKVFYLYNPISIKNEITPKEEKKTPDNTLLYVVFGIAGFLLFAAIIVFIVICIYRRKKNDLLNNVNKISFVESGAKERTESLLLGNEDEKNEE